MRYRRLGGSGTQVSVLCLGAMTFGQADEKSMMQNVGADEKESFAMLDRALEAGIHLVDVSSVIFGARNVAQLEENLGAGDLELPAEAVARLDSASAPDLGHPTTSSRTSTRGEGCAARVGVRPAVGRSRARSGGGSRALRQRR
jgi:aryl-alcohol dehydrogenase-like predicted oxidoreductase